MTDATRIGRLGLMAAGLGIAAALAATPGVASADDFQISIDGFDLFPTAGNTATASSGMGDIAIAFGAGADATATGGSGDYALANGAGSTADVGNYGAGASEFDAAIASGTDSSAQSGGGNFDYAAASGDGTLAGAGEGSGDTAIASGTDSSSIASGDYFTDDAGTTFNAGNDDLAVALGPNTIAGSGALFTSTASSNDIAMVFDPFGTVGSSAYAGDGTSDLAAAFGDMLHALATAGNYLTDILPSL